MPRSEGARHRRRWLLSPSRTRGSTGFAMDSRLRGNDEHGAGMTRAAGMTAVVGGSQARQLTGCLMSAKIRTLSP